MRVKLRSGPLDRKEIKIHVPPTADFVHRAAIAVDMHADTAQRLVDENIDLNQHLSDGHLDAARMKKGGLDAQFFSIWVEPKLYGAGGASAIQRADAQIAALHKLAADHPETWALAVTADDIERIASDERLAMLMGMEGGYALDERLEMVERYFQMGVRYLSPAWSVSTSWAGSSGDATGQTRGLNDFGRRVIREMNRLGLIVDVSHVSDQTFWDIIETSSQPVIATHSGARSIVDVPRNLTDDQIRALGDTGGFCAVVFFPEFIAPGWKQRRARVDGEVMPLAQAAGEQTQGSVVLKNLARERVRQREYAARLPPVTAARVVDHIDYVVKLIGVEGAGLGSDFDGIPATPDDLSSIADLPNLTVELLNRGYSAADVHKILGGNVLRVMRAVEQ